MFKPFYGQCPFCPSGKISLIVVKIGYCKYHNDMRKGKKKEPVKRQPIKKKFRKATGELLVFEMIWSERPHYSEISGAYLGEEMDIRFFSHCLSKGAYGRYRLLKENIFLETPDEHHEWEFGDTSDPKWDKKKLKKEELKRRYYDNHP